MCEPAFHCLLEINSREIQGKQNSLFPKGPVIRDDFQSILHTLESLFGYVVFLHVRHHKM